MLEMPVKTVDFLALLWQVRWSTESPADWNPLSMHVISQYCQPEETKGAARVVAAGIDTLVTLRPRLFVVFILLAMLTTEEVVLVAEVEAVEKVVEGWSEVVFSILVC